MRVLRFTLGSLKTNCYLVTDGTSGEALLLDPAQDGEWLVEEAARQGLRVSIIVCTHSHFDHIGGVAAARSLTGAAFMIGRNALPSLREESGRAGTRHGLAVPAPPEPDQLLDEWDELTVGGLRFRVLDTPGHWRGDISLYAPEGAAVFVGDAIFRREIGRFNTGCDIPLLLESIATRLLTLPDDTTIYPGHGPATTVGYERIHNRGLREAAGGEGATESG